ncbi:MAG: HAD-IC family P-type ATPase, partial [Candidatus Marinimicrobia bacterium]|nr:HAD-IC family P-type ATPase [Candidatus Neomarinimicrobiota bacterium]
MNETARISIGGVDCQGCAVTIEKNVKSLNGVDMAEVNVIRGDLSISFDPDIISSEKISNKVKSLGYTVGDKDRQISVFKVSGMDCATEEMIIQNSLGREKGIHNLGFDLISERLTVEHSLSSHAIIQNISAAGFKAEIEGKEQIDDGKDRIRKRILLTIISGLFIAAGAVLDFRDIFQQAVIPLYVAAMLFGGILMARKGFYALKTLTLDMNFLMTLAVIGAAFIGEWLEGAMVIFLFSIAELLEAGSLNRARNAIQSLMELAPDTARVIRDNGEFETRNIDNIDVGTLISVRPGERIPLDGEVIETNGFINEAPITGESISVEKVNGDPVYAGSINGDSAFKIKVTRLSSDSTITRIIKLVEEARSNKSPSEKFVDKFSRYYTPIVVGLSAAMVIIPTLIFDASFDTWFYRALVLL